MTELGGIAPHTVPVIPCHRGRDARSVPRLSQHRFVKLFNYLAMVTPGLTDHSSYRVMFIPGLTLSASLGA
jgi:hypothetical protein